VDRGLRVASQIPRARVAWPGFHLTFVGLLGEPLLRKAPVGLISRDQWPPPALAGTFTPMAVLAKESAGQCQRVRGLPDHNLTGRLQVGDCDRS
jgi:hypothetical protein